MSLRDFKVTTTDTHVTIVIKRTAAERMAVVLEDCGDWIGNMEGDELDMTPKQLSAAENDLGYLATALNGEQPTKASE